MCSGRTFWTTLYIFISGIKSRELNKHAQLKRFQISVNKNVTVASGSGDQISSMRDRHPSIEDIHHRNWRRDEGLLYDWRRRVTFKFPPNSPLNDFVQPSGWCPVFRRLLQYLFKREPSSYQERSRLPRTMTQFKERAFWSLRFPLSLCLCLSVCFSLSEFLGATDCITTFINIVFNRTF